MHSTGKIIGLSLIPILFLAACKPSPVARYREIAAIGAERGYASLQEALANESAVRTLGPGSSVQLKLRPSDPILRLKDSIDYYANFQLIGLAPGIRKLQVRSLCSCIGARKYLLLPRLLWIPPGGEAQVLEPSLAEIREPDMTRPIHLYQEYELPDSMETPSVLLLHADNRSLGEVIARSTNTTFVYLDPGYMDVEVPYRVRLSPVGRVGVESR